MVLRASLSDSEAAFAMNHYEAYRIPRVYLSLETFLRMLHILACLANLAQGDEEIEFLHQHQSENRFSTQFLVWPSTKSALMALIRARKRFGTDLGDHKNVATSSSINFRFSRRPRDRLENCKCAPTMAPDIISFYLSHSTRVTPKLFSTSRARPTVLVPFSSKVFNCRFSAQE